MYTYYKKIQTINIFSNLNLKQEGQSNIIYKVISLTLTNKSINTN